MDPLMLPGIESPRRRPTYKAKSHAESKSTRKRLASSTDVWSAMADLGKSDREHMVVFDLDTRHRVIERRIVAIGTMTSVEVHPREVFKPAIMNGAAAMVLSHNHPSGDPTPSREDIALTTRLREVGDLVGITVLDHVVVGAEGYVSLADRGGWN